MTLDQLITLAGTDPSKLETMSDSELKTYLAPLFPETRPSAERQQIVQQQTKRAELSKQMNAMDNLAKMLGNMKTK